MRENRLRWFGHMQKKTFDAPIRRIESIIVEGKRARGRLRRTWDEQIKVDLHELHLSVDLTRDRGNWRRLIHALDYWFPLHLLVSVLVLWLLLVLLFLLLFFNCYFYFIVYICIVFMFKGHTWAIQCKPAELPSTWLGPSHCRNFSYSFSSWGTLWPRSPLWVWAAVVLPSPYPYHSFYRWDILGMIMMMMTTLFYS